MAFKDSPYGILNQLCKKFYRDNHPNEPINKNKVRKNTFKAMEILLKHKKQDISIIYDTRICLEKILFGIQLLARYDNHIMNMCKKFESCIESIKKEPYFETETGQNMLRLLIYMKNLDALEKELNMQAKRIGQLHVPGLMTIYDNFHNNPYFPTNYELKLNFQYQYDFFINMQKNVLKFNTLEILPTLPKILKNSFYIKNIFDRETNKTEEEVESFSLEIHPDEISSVKDENIEKKFASESGEILSFFCMLPSASTDRIYIIDSKNFLKDLKFLTIGIQSDSFQLDENRKFYIKSNLTIDSICPKSMVFFVKDFIECGTCYKAIKCLISQQDYKNVYKGFMFEAFSNAVTDYLYTFAYFVTSLKDKSIFHFKNRMENVMKGVVALSFILNLHPEVKKESFKLPISSYFLGYLYDEICKGAQNEIQMLFMYILKKCCHIYFSHLKMWVYNGVVDPCNELFICYTDQYKKKTKIFFEKAYYVQKESVPGFFKNYEDQILKCGRYTMLLKEYNPEHNFFKIGTPSIRVCLNDDDLSKVKSECRIYLNDAKKLWGRSVSVKDIIYRRNEAQRIFLKSIAKRNQQYLEKWNEQQEELKIELLREKQNKLADIQKQIEDNTNRSIKTKRDNLHLEIKMLEHIQSIEDEQEEYKNIQLRANVAYYQELNDIIDCHLKDKKRLQMLKNNHKEIPNIILNVNSKDFVFEKIDGKNSEKLLVSKDNLSLEGNRKTNYEHNKNENVTNMKKSSSDILNSNEIFTEVINESKKDINTEYKSIRDKMRNTDNRNYFESQTDNKLISQQSKNSTFKSEIEDINSNIFENDFNANLKENLTDANEIEYNLCTKVSENNNNIELNLPIDQLISPNLNISNVDLTPMSTSSDKAETEDFKTKNIDNVLNDSNDNYITETIKTCDNITKNTCTKTIGQTIEKDEMFDWCENILKNNTKCLLKTDIFRSNPIFCQDNSLFNDNNNNNNNNNIKTNISIFSFTEFIKSSFVIPINVHLKIISTEIMRIFFEDLDILSHFETLQNYFFLIDEEFSRVLCKELILNIEKGFTPSELFHFPYLHMTLQNALGLSLKGNNSNAENFSFIVNEIPKEFNLRSPSVLENLNLTYRISWPLNLILNSSTFEKYNKIFKHLIKIKRISLMFDESFQLLKELNKTNQGKIFFSPQYQRIQKIRHKMYQFIVALENHTIENAVNASWKIFQDNILNVISLEDLYQQHKIYIKRILFLCMLDEKIVDFYNIIDDIFKILIQFNRNLKSKTWKIDSKTGHFTHYRFKNMLVIEKDFDKQIKNFLHLSEKGAKHEYQEEMQGFVYLINFNSFYNKNM